VRAWELLKLALEGVRRTPLRLALTSLGVAIATGALVAMVAFAEGLQAQAEKPFQDLEWFNRIDVFLERPGGGPGAGPPRKREAPVVPAATILDDAALAAFRKIPGVALAYPDVAKGGIEVVAGGKTVSAFATSLPREAAQMPFAKSLLKAGRPFASAGAKELLIGSELAKDLGVAIGDKLRIVSAENRDDVITIVGIFLILLISLGSVRLATLAFITMPVALVGGLLAAFWTVRHGWASVPGLASEPVVET